MYIPPNFKILFDPQQISNALWIDEWQVLKEFKDGRVVSRFSEYWTEKLYGFKKSNNSNTSGHDGTIENPLFGTLYVCVRSLTKTGIKFQQSKFIGSGRNCTSDNLIESIKGIDFEIVVDIVDFPCILLSAVSADNLLKMIEDGKITPGGLSRIGYYSKVFNTTFDKMSVKTINPYQGSDSN